MKNSKENLMRRSIIPSADILTLFRFFHRFSTLKIK